MGVEQHPQRALVAVGNIGESSPGEREVDVLIGEQIEPAGQQVEVVVVGHGQPEFAAGAAQPVVQIEIVESIERLGRQPHGLVVIVGDQRQQRLGESSHVPLADRRLIAVGVPSALVDRAEHGTLVEALHECTRTEVDRLA